jgi:hypothetical protein
MSFGVKRHMKYWSFIKTVPGFLFIAASVACSDPRNISIPPVNTIPPSPPHSRHPSATLDFDHPQKLLFLYPESYFDQHKQAWITQYFSLPPKWNAIQLGIDSDWCHGIVELLDGRTIRWWAGLGVKRADFDSPGAEVIWKRTDVDATVTYGVIRRPDRLREFQAESTGAALAGVEALTAGEIVVFTIPASSEPLSDIVTFITPISIPAPCTDCVIPRPRR